MSWVLWLGQCVLSLSTFSFGWSLLNHCSWCITYVSAKWAVKYQPKWRPVLGGCFTPCHHLTRLIGCMNLQSSVYHSVFFLWRLMMLKLTSSGSLRAAFLFFFLFLNFVHTTFTNTTIQISSIKQKRKEIIPGTYTIYEGFRYPYKIRSKWTNPITHSSLGKYSLISHIETRKCTNLELHLHIKLL